MQGDFNEFTGKISIRFSWKVSYLELQYFGIINNRLFN